MKIKNALYQFLIYLIIYIICTAIWVGLFHTPILSGYSVLMYKGLFFVILTGILSAILMAFAKKKWSNIGLTGKDVFVMFVGFCCFNTVFFTLIPVTVERSVSVFTLSYMESHDDHLYTQEDVRDVFVDIYVDEYQAFEKRFNEQVVSKNLVEVEPGKYQLTDNGKAIVHMFRAIAEVFDTDRRLVQPTN